MLSNKTVLRRLPTNINPTQALFLDGLRYSVEIIDLAYNRLRETLTELAVAEIRPDVLPRHATLAFLDAWAIVDAVDRFRMLCEQMPRMTLSPGPDGTPTLTELAAPIRKLRNVADHLAQRAEYVVSHGGSALGELTWFTGLNLQPLGGVMCRLRPGTLRSPPEHFRESVEMKLEWPTDRICLIAGGHDANLSLVIPQIALRIGVIEQSVERSLETLGERTGPVMSDVLLRYPYKPAV